ncbi:MAG: adenosine kinase [Nanoarchaeota archaeon]|nr:adenosine kinase [Nanoarchaeota archaeon]MBU1005540.1 adenosine kinase [Nanoarchaeota archaeon]MBU1946599.1 adenosine kinase [Nanoarchaeota archaeon]
MAHDVVSIGNPLMDIIIEVEESFLKEINLVKGNMHLLNEQDISKIEKSLEKHNKKLIPGGSEANTLTALAMLGHSSIYFGKVGKDNHGTIYHKKLMEDGVISKVIKVDGMTGRAITLITPDSERTFATHLGVATLLENSEINEADIIQAKFLHLTAYVFGGKIKEAAMQALNIAKNNNVKICIDLADVNIIKNNKASLTQIVKEFAYIIIANENEAKEFTGKDPEQAVDELSKLAEIAIVKLGENGSLIKSKGKLIKVHGFKVKAIDTTGAGDIYTAGFLYGLLNDLSLETSGKIASFIASKVVQVKGARLDKIPIEEIKQLKKEK